MSPQTNIEETEMLNLDPKEKDLESPKDGRCKNRRKLTKKCLLILIGIILSIVGVTVTGAVVYYPREPPKPEDSIQEKYANQLKKLHAVGCTPKAVVLRNVPHYLHMKDDLIDCEIENWDTVISQCNENNSYCGVNGNCTCVPTENGQTNAIVPIKFRNLTIPNAEWQIEYRTLDIMEHKECVGKPV